MGGRLSFRDPGGQVFISDNRVFRKINATSRKDINISLSSAIVRQCIDNGRVVNTYIRDPKQLTSMLPDAFISDSEILLEHPKIFFPSYPSEWPPEMLHAAAALTLELAESLLAEGMGLKDATPYNILFQGSNPVFVDILSIEFRNPLDPIWLPQAQFERTFLLPLFANRHFQITLDQIFLSKREGLEPEQLYRLCSPLQRLIPPLFSVVTLPVWLGKQAKPLDKNLHTPRHRTDNAEKVQFILEHSFRRLQRFLNKSTPNSTSKISTWSNYETKNSYSTENYAAKSALIQEIVNTDAVHSVLDIGCNTGHFSQIAARSGAQVIAIDQDPVVIGQLWEGARRENLNIQPLVVNIAHPTPATGWHNEETLSFLDRAIGYFDTVFMLAILHHLLVTERIPLRGILELAAGLTTNRLVIEFVGTEDPMFRLLCRGRDKLYQWYTREVFEQTAVEFFEIIRSVCLGDAQRWVYLMKKRDP